MRRWLAWAAGLGTAVLLTGALAWNRIDHAPRAAGGQAVRAAAVEQRRVPAGAASVVRGQGLADRGCREPERGAARRRHSRHPAGLISAPGEHTPRLADR